jgi:hypothetical protein
VEIEITTFEDYSIEITQPYETRQFRSSDIASLKGVRTTDQGSVNLTSPQKSDVSVTVFSATSEQLVLPSNATKVNQPANIHGMKEAISTESNPLDLCTIIQHSKVDTYLDYPMGIGKQYLRFHLGPKIARQKEGSISLQGLLEGDPHHFPPAKRALVATILASSLLQLQRTHWIKDNWSKRDVFFRTQDGMVIFEQLYL